MSDAARCFVASHDSQNTDLVPSRPAGPVLALSLPARQRSWTPLQALFLSRLSRLLHLEAEWRARAAADPARLSLIHNAIYSTYCDCLASGIEADARELVQRSRVASPS
jgi:hypothetical protein